MPASGGLRAYRRRQGTAGVHPFRPIAVRVASAFKLREIHECIRERFAVRILFAPPRSRLKRRSVPPSQPPILSKRRLTLLGKLKRTILPIRFAPLIAL